jgi:hypothetical protein
VASFRVVIKNPRFERELRETEPDPQRADEAVEAMEFALARHPERGFPVASFFLWPIYIRNLEYVVYYTFDDMQVELTSLRPSGEDSW